jgi:hypothetical protein
MWTCWRSSEDKNIVLPVTVASSNQRQKRLARCHNPIGICQQVKRIRGLKGGSKARVIARPCLQQSFGSDRLQGLRVKLPFVVASSAYGATRPGRQHGDCDTEEVLGLQPLYKRSQMQPVD